MTKPLALVYDFLWDDQQDLGVWVKPKDSEDLVLVEAMVCKYDPDANCGLGEFVDLYMLASAITLQPQDRVLRDNAGSTSGGTAQKHLDALRSIQKSGTYFPVNEQQERLVKEQKEKQA